MVVEWERKREMGGLFVVDKLDQHFAPTRTHRGSLQHPSGPNRQFPDRAIANSALLIDTNIVLEKKGPRVVFLHRRFIYRNRPVSEAV